MPLEARDVWNEDLVVPADEIVEKINKAIPIEPIVRGSEPAEGGVTWTVRANSGYRFCYF